MSQKKSDNLGHSHKGSIVEYLTKLGIPSKDTTLDKIGQTTLIFTNRSQPSINDDSLEASLRKLKHFAEQAKSLG